MDCSKQVQTSVMLLSSLSNNLGKDMNPSYPPSFGLNNTSVLLQG